jgi:hypothetical protein
MRLVSLKLFIKIEKKQSSCDNEMVVTSNNNVM